MGKFNLLSGGEITMSPFPAPASHAEALVREFIVSRGMEAWNLGPGDFTDDGRPISIRAHRAMDEIKHCLDLDHGL